jgi:hypothetical protein
MPDISQIMASARRREATVPICLAGDLAGEVDLLQQQLLALPDEWQPGSLADVHPRQELAERIGELRAEMAEHTVHFQLRALGHIGFADLVAAHPATDPKSPVPYDPATFLPALVAGCCTDPVMTIAQALDLLDILNDGQARALYAAALAVNEEPSPLPF